MVLEPFVHQLHDAYIGHAVRCPDCYAPSGRYCAAGRALKLDYLANYLLSLDLSTRRSVLAHMERHDLDECDALKVRMIDVHASEKAETVKN